MIFRLAVLVLLGLVAVGRAAEPLGAEDYERVRRAALRDPKVKEALEQAYLRLDSTILQLEPRLSEYVRSHPSGWQQVQGASVDYRTDRPDEQRRAVKPVSKPASAGKRAPVVSRGRTHTVVAGETLGGIAERYGTTSAALQKANGIEDASMVRAGEVLRIPGKGRSLPPAPSSPTGIEGAGERLRGR